MNQINKLLITFWLLSLPLYSQNDVEGSKDHPLVLRYPGSTIIYYDKEAVGSYDFTLGPLAKPSANEEYELTDTRKLNGTITRIQYRINEEDITRIVNYYEHSLKSNGFELLAISKSGKPMEVAGRNWTLAAFENLPYKYKSNISGIKSGKENRYYIAGIIQRVNTKANLAMIINEFNKGEIYIQVDVIDTGKELMDEKILSAEEIAQNLNVSGFAVISGVYFESNNADILEGSELALVEVAEYLNNNRGVTLYVVGHTGMTGNLEFQIALSKSMADAFIKTLEGRYNVNSERLISEGVGPLSPVTTNQNIDGRKTNQRIELVIKNF